MKSDNFQAVARRIRALLGLPVLVTASPTLTLTRSHALDVCEDAEEDAFGLDESSTSDDGIASDDGESSTAQSSDTSSIEGANDDEDGYAIPHIQDLFLEDLEDG